MLTGEQIISIAESIHIAVGKTMSLSNSNPVDVSITSIAEIVIGVHSYGLGRHLITLHNEQVVDFQKVRRLLSAIHQ